jgi:hypothetical protein
MVIAAGDTRTRSSTVHCRAVDEEGDDVSAWLKGNVKMEQQGALSLLLQSLLWSGRLGLPAECRQQHCIGAQAALQASKQEQAQVQHPILFSCVRLSKTAAASACD